VYCIQNHDQIGNRPFGQRMNVTASHADFMAATLLMLLLPQTPMLFQGQEFLASHPFLYFTDHDGDLGQAVTEGRRREFGAFRSFSDPRSVLAIPDPQEEATFLRSILDHDEGEYGLGQLARELHKSALSVRASDPVLREYRKHRLPISTSSRGRTLVVEFECKAGKRWIAVNFGDALTLRVPGAEKASVVLSSNEGRFGGNGVEPALRKGRLSIPAHSCVFLSAS
jgi:maltooligosyltrehalose trehalohydrolase